MPDGNRSPPLRVKLLTTLWNWLGPIGGTLALSNMTSIWLQDFHTWRGFLLDVFTVYGSIMKPVSHFLFGRLPFEVWEWLGDYFIVSALLCSSYYKGYTQATNSPFMTAFYPNITKRDISKQAIGALVVWPVVFAGIVFLSIFLVFARLFGVFGDVENTLSDIVLLTWQWLATTVLGVLVLFSINTAL